MRYMTVNSLFFKEPIIRHYKQRASAHCNAGHQNVIWLMCFGLVYRTESVTQQWWPMNSRERGNQHCRDLVLTNRLHEYMDSKGNVSCKAQSLYNPLFEMFNLIYFLKLWLISEPWGPVITDRGRQSGFSFLARVCQLIKPTFTTGVPVWPFTVSD